MKAKDPTLKYAWEQFQKLRRKYEFFCDPAEKEQLGKELSDLRTIIREYETAVLNLRIWHEEEKQRKVPFIIKLKRALRYLLGKGELS